MTVNVQLTLGDPEVDVWHAVEDANDFTHYPALNNIPAAELFAEGKLFAWVVEMDTKYAESEAVNAPYVSEGYAVARFWMPGDTWLEEGQFFTPTDFTVTLPEGEWQLRVLGGRYDHLVLIMPAGVRG